MQMRQVQFLGTVNESRNLCEAWNPCAVFWAMIRVAAVNTPSIDAGRVTSACWTCRSGPRWAREVAGPVSPDAISQWQAQAAMERGRRRDDKLKSPRSLRPLVLLQSGRGMTVCSVVFSPFRRSSKALAVLVMRVRESS